MGRPENPITDDGPAAEFAAKLRALRQASGRKCRTIAANAKLSTASISKAAAGRSLPSWKTTEGFVRACGVTDPDDIETWKADWDKARRACDALKPREGRSRGRRTIPEQRSIEADTTKPAEPGGDQDTSSNPKTVIFAVMLPALGPVDLDRFRVQEDYTKRRSPAALAVAATMADLVELLNDLVTEQGFDISRRVLHPPAVVGHADAVPQRCLLTPPVRDVLTGRRPPYLDVVLQIVNACNGTRGDLDEWARTWQRIQDGQVSGSTPGLTYPTANAAERIVPSPRHPADPGGPAPCRTTGTGTEHYVEVTLAPAAMAEPDDVQVPPESRSHHLPPLLMIILAVTGGALALALIWFALQVIINWS